MTERTVAADPKPPKGGLRLLASFKGTEKDLLALFSILEAHRKMEELATKSLAAFNEVDWVAASPDGLLGGQGYMMPVRELREKVGDILRMLGESKHPLIDECYHNPAWRGIKSQYMRENFPSNTVPEPEIPVDDGTDEPGPGIENLPEESRPEKLQEKTESLEREMEFQFTSGHKVGTEQDSVLVALHTAADRGIREVNVGELLLISNEMGGNFKDSAHISSCVASLIRFGSVQVDESTGFVTLVE